MKNVDLKCKFDLKIMNHFSKSLEKNHLGNSKQIKNIIAEIIDGRN